MIPTPSGLDSGERARDPVELAHATLGLTYREIAQAISADESTLHRWRAGVKRPSPVFVGRLASLDHLLVALDRTFATRELAAIWIDTPLQPLGGRTPRMLLAEGRADLLAGVLAMVTLAAPSADGDAPASVRAMGATSSVPSESEP